MPDIRYRLIQDIYQHWHVLWLCGSKWLRVFGPATEDEARAYMSDIVDAMAKVR